MPHSHTHCRTLSTLCLSFSVAYQTPLLSTAVSLQTPILSEVHIIVYRCFFYIVPPPSSSVVTTAKPVDRQPNSAREEQQIFIRSFVFQPALPIKIDYTTKWRFPTDTMVSRSLSVFVCVLCVCCVCVCFIMWCVFSQGTLPGILISLYHLDNSELTLKSLNCKKGYTNSVHTYYNVLVHINNTAGFWGWTVCWSV